MTLPADLPARLKAAGLAHTALPGWRTRRRPGLFTPVGVLWHHTGSADDGLSMAKWMTTTGRDDLPAPLCQLSIDRGGHVYIGAAGRANHAGWAEPSGTVAGGDGNKLYVGVEMHNNGTEGWSPRQYEAGVTLGAVLAQVLNTSAQAQRAHAETSVTGKWDPGKLDMDLWRNRIASKVAAANKPAVPPRKAGPSEHEGFRRLISAELRLPTLSGEARAEQWEAIVTWRADMLDVQQRLATLDRLRTDYAADLKHALKSPNFPLTIEGLERAVDYIDSLKLKG